MRNHCLFPRRSSLKYPKYGACRTTKVSGLASARIYRLKTRRRRKIADDPNNTAWTRSDCSYGQKILSAQGWAPGRLLGATNAAHASHYSSASSSHVRVSIKDDTLGLGASRRQVEAQSSGLGTFQDLLGRLNGKSEVQIEKEQEARRSLGHKIYSEQRFGSTRFVKGGYLVGDKIEESAPEFLKSTPEANGTGIRDPLKGRATTSKEKTDGFEGRVDDRQERRKRRPDAEEQNTVTIRASGIGGLGTPGTDGEESIEPASKFEGDSASADHSVAQTRTEVTDTDKDSKLRRREERRQRKEERRLRREAKRAARVEAPSEDRSLKDLGCSAEVKSGSDVDEPVPNAPPKSVPLAEVGIRGVRQRYIRQKRMAGLDSQAMRGEHFSTSCQLIKLLTLIRNLDGEESRLMRNLVIITHRSSQQTALIAIDPIYHNNARGELGISDMTEQG